jgi:hypothetical protein
MADILDRGGYVTTKAEMRIETGLRGTRIRLGASGAAVGG